MAKSVKLKNNFFWSRNSIKRDYIKVVATTDQKLSEAGDMNVLFQKEEINVGNGFILKDGKIVINSDNIHHVRVSVLLWVERYNNSYAWCRLTKNGINCCAYMLGNSDLDAWNSIQLYTILDVKKNDEVYPKIQFNKSSTYNAIKGKTYANSCLMIVEAID